MREQLVVCWGMIMSRKMIFGLMVMVFGLSIVYADDLQSKYKSMMDEDTKQSANVTSKLGKFINELKNYKKDEFETVREFDKRINDKIINFGTQNFNVGTVVMKSYNSNKEEVTVRVDWDNDFKLLLSQKSLISEAKFEVSKKKAKKAFSNGKQLAFRMGLSYIDSRLFVTDIKIHIKNEKTAQEITKNKNSDIPDWVRRTTIENEIYSYGVNPVSSYNDLMYISVEGMTWDKALRYCNQLDYLGYMDWRLPKAEEIHNDFLYFPIWTTLTKEVPIIGTYAWQYNYNNSSYEKITNTIQVVCVRDIK